MNNKPFLIALAACGITLTTACAMDVEPADEPAVQEPITPTESFIDLDYDGVEDGYNDPTVVVQDGSATPVLKLHNSILLSRGANYCLSGFGYGTSNGWEDCFIGGAWDDEFEWLYFSLVDSGDGNEWRVNARLNSSECVQGAENYNSTACWANLTDQARRDDYVTRNTDGSYAMTFVVIDNWAYPGSGDGTGEE